MICRFTISRAFLLAAVLLLFVGAAAAQDLTGYWDVRTPSYSGDGTFRDTYFRIEQSGETVSGELIRKPAGIPITGTFKDEALHFVTVPPVPPPPPPGQPPRRQMLPITYDGTLENGRLMLTTHGRMGEIHSVAEKVTKEATEPPAALPLPALKTLPDNGLAKTPPMGWNSWNKFAGRVDDAAVRGMADAMVASGMRDAGYVYINIDDTWELGRDANGNLIPNKKFPDMRALADYVHSKGLKIGIYSSPGPKTCAGYEGSYGHVTQDAKTIAAWGIDYLKYDLCSDLDIYKDDAPTLQAIYQEMGEALQATHRDIIYSLCEYGRAQVWTGWGEKAGGNLWRTTGDISDRWDSMDRIGFDQIKLAAYAKPGHWNDPDMLEIGNGGMTVDEYRTHMSLWSLLAAPLIAGNDLRSMTDETRNILLNREVIAIDQDPGYKPVGSISSKNGLETLMRPLADGSVVVGLFNRTSATAEMFFPRESLPASFNSRKLALRDLWKHEAAWMAGERFTAIVPTHGVVLVKISAE
ncbi:MAG TPA: glycoside hydrolase family 27 protein [Terriglobales bacterium]|nr:glycoside hydrolase family 27 protein [Terriglobales bacterium]